MLTSACLLCLKVNKKQTRICSKKGFKLNLANIIAKHFWLRPSTKKSSKESVCSICWHELKDFHQFYLTIAEAHHHLDAVDTLSEPLTSIVTKGIYKESNELKDLPCTEIKFEVNDLELLPQIEVIENISVAEVDVDDSIKQLQVDTNLNSSLESDDDLIPLSMLVTGTDIYNTSGTEHHMSFNEIKVSNTNIIAEDNKSSTRIKIRGRPRKNRTDEEVDETKPSVDPTIEKIQEQTFASSESIKSDSSDYIVHLSELESDSEGKWKKQKKKYDKNILKFFKNLKCSRCVFLCSNFDYLKKHARTLHQSNAPSVECCGRKFYMRRTLSDHALFHLSPEHLKCSYPKCDKIFQNSCKLEEHKEMHKRCIKTKNFQCDKCPKKFSTKNNLQEHQASHISKAEYKFPCNECNLKFATRFRLGQHKKFFHSLSRVCDICGERVSNSISLKRHMLKHSENPNLSDPVQCDICGKWLKQANSLTQHKIWVHKNRTEQYCPICKKTAVNLRSLERHISRSHQTKDKFKCTICGKVLKTARELRDHTNIHTKEVIYKCEICFKSFSRKEGLVKHKRNFHSDNPSVTRTQCEICSAWLCSSYGLKHHIQTVHATSGSCEYRCQICNRVSVHEIALRRHIKRNHGLESLLNYTFQG